VLPDPVPIPEVVERGAVMSIQGIEFSSGYITLTFEGGTKTRYPIASVLRALDIPTGLTYQQVGAITTLANLVAVLIRTLISRQVLNESFLEDDEYDLDAIIGSIEAMGGTYHEPDISVVS
jgi:hypothetical protein